MEGKGDALKKNLGRRMFLKKTGKALLGLGLAAPFMTQSACSSSSADLRIGYLPITDATALLIAYSLGYFQEEGLKVQKPVMIRGWSGLVEAFLSGKINLAHFLLPIPIWMRYNRDTPVKIIAWAHTNGSALTMRKDSEVKSFGEMGGKTIAVPYWYSMHNVILQLALRTVGLKPVIKGRDEPLNKDEVNLLILPPPEMPITLASKKIDGFIVAEPFNALSEAKMDARIFRFTGDMWKNHPCCTVVVHEQLIKTKPVMVQKITNALVRAQKWILRNREKTARLLSKEGENFIPVSERVLRRVFNGYEYEKYGRQIPQAIKHPRWDIHRIGFQPYPFPSASRFIFDEMRKTLVSGDDSFLQKYSADFVAKDIMAPDFVIKAISLLGGPAVFPELDLTSPWTREEVIDI